MLTFLTFWIEINFTAVQSNFSTRFLAWSLISRSVVSAIVRPVASILYSTYIPADWATLCLLTVFMALLLLVVRVYLLCKALMVEGIASETNRWEREFHSCRAVVYIGLLYNFLFRRFSIQLTYTTDDQNSSCLGTLPSAEVSMRQAPAKDAAAAPAHPFSEWNLVQYHTGKQRIII